MNKVILIGRLGKDAEVKKFENGLQLVSFPLATKDFLKTAQGERKELTDWHNIKAWGDRWDTLVPYLTKGKEVVCVGKIKYRKNETPAGITYYTDIEINELNLVGSKESAPENPLIQAAQQHQQQAQQAQQAQPFGQTVQPQQVAPDFSIMDEALPF